MLKKNGRASLGGRVVEDGISGGRVELGAATGWRTIAARRASPGSPRRHQHREARARLAASTAARSAAENGDGDTSSVATLSRATSTRWPWAPTPRRAAPRRRAPAAGWSRRRVRREPARHAEHAAPASSRSRNIRQASTRVEAVLAERERAGAGSRPGVDQRHLEHVEPLGVRVRNERPSSCTSRTPGWSASARESPVMRLEQRHARCR